MYPRGKEGKDRFVSLYLECVSAQSFAQHQKIKAEVEISISEHGDDHFSHRIKCK